MRHLHHGDPRDTELEALAKVAPHLKAMKRGIYIALTRAGDRGMTPEEYQIMKGLVLNTVRRRFTDLWKAGEITPNGRSRRNDRGNRSTVWILGRDPELERSRSQSMAEVRAECDRLRAENLRLKSDLVRLGGAQLELGL